MKIESKIKCHLCGSFDGYHVISCPSYWWSEETRKREGIVVNKGKETSTMRITKDNWYLWAVALALLWVMFNTDRVLETIGRLIGMLL